MPDMPDHRFAQVGEQDVHYLVEGAGPPVLLLHQTPRSSAELIALMGRWADDFCCIAPDLPGFGLSEPLPGGSGLDAFGDFVVGFMDAIGLPRALVYGLHAGASIGLAAAVRYPDRIVGLVGHGYPAWTAEDRRDRLANGLTTLDADCNGDHLRRAWEHVVSQHRVSVGGSMDLAEKQSPGMLTAEAIDLLRAGKHCRTAEAAFLESDARRVGKLAVPALLVGEASDPLTAHLDRIGRLLRQVTTSRVEKRDIAQNAAHDFLLEQDLLLRWMGFPDTRRHRPIAIEADGFSSKLHAITGDATLRTLVVHEPGGSAATAMADHEAQDVAAIDLPGHGLSRRAPVNLPASAWPRIIEAAARKLGLEQRRSTIRLLGPAMAFAPILQMRGWTVAGERSRALDDPGFAAHYLPDLTPSMDGSHLLRAWQCVCAHDRSDTPSRNRAEAGRDPGDADLERLSARHVALLEAVGARDMVQACAQLARTG